MSDEAEKPASWVSKPENAAAIESREVYALAGLALFAAQCLEHEIVNLLSMSTIVRAFGALRPVTRAAVLDLEAQVDSIWDENFERTMGQLLKRVTASGIKITMELEQQMKVSLEARNRLVHRYFREQAKRWFDADGRRSMAEELTGMRSQFGNTDQAIHEVTLKWGESLGVTEENVCSLTELMKSGASETEIETVIRNLQSRSVR